MEYKCTFGEKEFSFEQGEFVLLCGKTGSGKTTFLRQIEKELKKAGCKTGFVFQNFDAQIVTDKVWHELSFGLENTGCNPKLMHRRVAELASYFGITDWMSRPTESLSGGQKQLLNLASVMALKPDFILLDEPVSQLDPVAAGNFINTVKKINRELGTTVIMSEHRLEDLFCECSRIVLLDKMQIAVNAAPVQALEWICQKGDKAFIEFLPAASRLALKAKSSGKIPMTVAEGRQWYASVKDGSCAEGVLLPAAEWRAQARNSGQPDGRMPEADCRNAQKKEIALKIKNLSFRYGKKMPFVLEELNLEIEKGTIHGIVGANGSGKSTLLKLLAGVLKGEKGKIERNGLTLMMSQQVRDCFSRTTVALELEEVGIKLEEEVGKIITAFEVSMERHPYDLSGGEMQKLALVKMLKQNPEIILLDEPTKALDNCFKKELGKILKKLSAQGRTVVLVCHDLEFCAGVADKVSMMFEGQLVGTADAREFFAENNFYTTAVARITDGDMVYEDEAYES